MSRPNVASGLPGSDAFPASVPGIAATVVEHAFDHLTTIERESTGTGAWGGPVDPTWNTVATDVPCIAMAVTKRGADAGAVRTPGRLVGSSGLATIEDRRVLVAFGTDVQTGDRLTDVTLSGETIFSGPMTVDAVLRQASYLELVVEEVR